MVAIVDAVSSLIEIGKGAVVLIVKVVTVLTVYVWDAIEETVCLLNVPALTELVLHVFAEPAVSGMVGLLLVVSVASVALDELSPCEFVGAAAHALAE